jgi:hypothetical protein
VNAELHALTRVNREIEKYGRAVARGDFTSLERALAPAEQRRATLQAELARLDGSQQPAVVQLTPAMHERHLQGMTEKLRSGVNGKVREVIQQSIARILVDVDGSLSIEAKPDGLLGVKGNLAQMDYQEGRTLLEQGIVSPGGGQGRLTTAGESAGSVIPAKQALD